MNRGIAIVCLALFACTPPNKKDDASDSTPSNEPDDPPAPVPGAPCEDDEQCPGRCLEGSCVDTCAESMACPGRLICVDGLCVAPLPAPPPCPGSLLAAPMLTVTLPKNGGAHTVGAADFDSDGQLELFAEQAGLWLIRLDDLTPAPILGGGSMRGAFETNIGDINGDRHLDLLPETGGRVLFGDGAGGFIEAPGPDPALVDGALGDLNGDGRADLIGFMHTCPLPTPPETECSGETLARWMRGESGWERIVQGQIWGPPRNVLVAPVLAGDAPVGIYEADLGFLVLGTFTAESWPAVKVRVEECSHCKRSALVEVRRGGDDRSELMRVAAREDQWTWGARVRMTGDYAEFPDQWALPGSYTHVAAGDVDQDGDDDLVLSGPKMLLLLDREEEPTGACIAEIPVTDTANAVGLAELDGAAPPELILGAAPGIVAYTLHWSP